MKKNFLIIASLVLTSLTASQKLPTADISFFIADLKYSEERGVKICEIQPGQISLFRGCDQILGQQGVIQQRLCELISQYQNQGWYFARDPGALMRQRFAEYGWEPCEAAKLTMNQEFLKCAHSRLYDPYSINSYGGILYARSISIGNIEQFRKNYPSMLILGPVDQANTNDKLLMSKIFLGNEMLENIKPIWKSYPFTYSEELVNTILNDIPSEYLVIKPRKGAMGCGIMILNKEELQGNLEAMTKKPEPIVMDPNNPNEAMKLQQQANISQNAMQRFWSAYKYDEFVVEEFIPSDPIVVDGLTYNATMRVVFVLTYDNHEVDIHYLGEYWTTPSKAFEEEGNLNQINKANVGGNPKFHPVDPEIVDSVQEQLREPLLLVYKRLLGLESY